MALSANGRQLGSHPRNGGFDSPQGHENSDALGIGTVECAFHGGRIIDNRIVAIDCGEPRM